MKHPFIARLKNTRWAWQLLFVVGIHLLTLLVFTLYRLVQYIALNHMIDSAGDASHLTAFVRGCWFDNVITCYVMVLPVALLLLAATFGYARRWTRRATVIWCSIFFALAFMASAANIPYFAYFFKNLDSSIFGWFGYVGTTTGMLLGESSYWLYIALYFVVLAVYIWLLRRWRRFIDRRIEQVADARPHWSAMVVHLVFSALLIALCIFGIRGRRGYNPIKISQAYYCHDPFLNQLGINPMFNLLTSTLDDLRKENSELHLMPYQEAITNVRRELGIDSLAVDSTQVLHRRVVAEGTPRHPNVVVILMESMSASLMQTFGQQQPLTPTLDSLYHTSLAFTRFYSAGIHTNHGITATLYSYPALMFRNLMKGTVTPRREGLPTVLHAEGYHNMFFMTHEAQYDNMNAFLLTNGYDEVFAEEQYPAEERVNSFGVPDKFLFDYALNAIRQRAEASQPFMATLLTISNHPPYIIPDWFHPKTSDPETQIVEYSDYCIGRFLAEASKESWYDNTIFVILADHGKLVGKSEAELPQSYNHIPLIIFGAGVTPALYEGLGTQVDVMPTLLGMMNISYDYDGFGQDLLRTPRHTVFYTSDTHVVGRDSTALFMFNPKAEQTFYYDVTGADSLRATTDSPHHQQLRSYAFSMVQTAEYLYRRQK